MQNIEGLCNSQYKSEVTDGAFLLFFKQIWVKIWDYSNSHKFNILSQIFKEIQ